MNKKDVLELRRRFVKDCTISRVAGCYVDANHTKVVTLNENFLNLKEEEFFKYLELAKKTLGGTVGNNILELDFPLEEEEMGGHQQFLMGVRASNLENEELLDRLYDQIIANYSYVGNYLILVFHDTYDIISRTSDNLKLDESEEVYDYILVTICPVTLSKPGLGYRIDENRIGARIRDWVVGSPDLGFLFPAFSDHSSDIHKVDYFVRDAKDSHAEFIEEVLGCGPKRTATEQRKALHAIVKKAFSDDEEKGDEVIGNIQESFALRTMDEMDASDDESHPLTAPLVLSDEVINEVFEESGISKEKTEEIKEVIKEEFADEMPMVADLVDEKLIKANEKEKRERELVKEVVALKEELKSIEEEKETYDVVLHIREDKAELIHSEIIGDKKCLVIPVDDGARIHVNGVERM